MGKKLVSLDHVVFNYEGSDSHAINDVSFDIYEGEWLAIVGHNGSGKSTLAKLLNGLHFASSGVITINGSELTQATVWEARRKIGMVFQNPDNQFVGTTVEDDVAFGLENNGIQQDIMAERVKRALMKVKMDAFLDQEPHHLSGGQKQRVAIAGVLALQPDIIILDEATSMLDPRGREEVLETVRELKEENVLTVVSITHDLEEAAKADRIIVMNKGQVHREGSPIEIFRLEDELIELGLDIPFSVKLSKALQKTGLDLKNDHLTEEELVKELCELHSKM
ncbi:energy-coupling factor ABC transporter ATP-binding protein [Peribacillus psychrosaccharolyticus]|uniref:Energy-coupling factor ABC transporter ATP-binding protein n=1 Tax=Peribacillus psychrosaccharolyticus TaxID=1407 RepID=A0A974NJ39_PERPY|nr:energy-coupling factor ABC transporter ATP-binding protein [Peribacillus psychrosaccharolyticus]MEC2057974.1 energy-coupling factor ABC transporter ATP-binding protein [Peribacillus psychrosaccharolyticus]MED3745850.1 energy-coupling factor ABC transporter ATP-binding protein [Peribacillus psychrosaccharolyticus]QQS98744.1 energy-coupling factor ABC transporter ATP-binding protein [Peribacillus psychrosaccharolyticus]